MSEWYLKWRNLTLAVGLGIIEVSSSNEMVLQMPRIWEQETTANQPKQAKIGPDNALFAINSRTVGDPEIEIPELVISE